MRAILFLSSFIWISFTFAKQPVSIKTASIYTDDFSLNNDGSVNLNPNWKPLSEQSAGVTTSKLYEKPLGNNLDKYAVEVRTSKETGLQSVTSYFGYKLNTQSETINHVAFDGNGKVTSNTMCWDKKACITINNELCELLLVRTGSKSTKDLVKQAEVCRTLASEFDEIYKGQPGLISDIRKIQQQNFSTLLNSQISKSYSNFSTRDFISRHMKSEAPRPTESYEGQMQIAFALSACDHYKSTKQFDESIPGFPSPAPAKGTQ